MNVQSESALARVDGSVAAAEIDHRLARAVVVALVIGGYVAVGFAFDLSADAYLLLGIPITIAFQALVARRPLRALWLRDGPAMRVTSRSVLAVILVAIAPAVIAVSGVRDGDPVLAIYGLAATFGAVGAVYALQAMTKEAARATVRASVINGAILVAVMVVFRLISGGFHGNPGALATAILSVATYLPVVFVMEEVLFRGLFDTYLHGSTGERDRASALYGSALWGLWHLPVASIGLGILTIPYLVAVHTALGFVLVSAWRRTRNLAAPGIAHAMADALRNAVAVL